MKNYNPELYYDLELNIMSCLLRKPELMEKCVLEDKHFKRYQKFWKFMRIFYSKYKCFDIPLMVSLASGAINKKNLVEYLSWVVDIVPSPNKFDYYQARLIEMFEENEKEKIIINDIYDLATELTIHKITLNEFYSKIEKMKGETRNE